jgi:hypothetical protein
MSGQPYEEGPLDCTHEDRPDEPLRGGKETIVTRVRPQVLSRQEIERRIEQVTSEVAGESAGASSECDAGGTGCMPRWITPGELVSRVRPFLVYN